MPASPTATHEHIKDVNTRYHDAAADEYDAKWGIDFGDVGQEQVRLKLVKALGKLDGGSFGDALEIGSGTGYFSLNLVQLGVIQRLTATDISPGMLDRLARTAEALGVENVSTVATEAEISDGHSLESEVDVHAFAPADLRRLLRDGGFENRRVGGEELLSNAWGWGLRTVESSAEPESIPFRWRRFAFQSYIALQKVDTRLLEPRLPAELFYHLLVSGRKPAA